MTNSAQPAQFAQPGPGPALPGGQVLLGMSELQAVLFDMDGLLVDSEPLWLEVEAAIMARMGSPWGPADQEHLIGGSLPRSTAYMQRKASAPVAQDVIARWLVQGMAELIRDRGVPLMPGAAELLAEIEAAGIPFALVTSAEREIMAAALDGDRGPVPGHRVRGRRDQEEARPRTVPAGRRAARRGARAGASRWRTRPPGWPPRTRPGARSSRCPACRRRPGWPG